MKYITPLYANIEISSKDVVCASYNTSVYEDKDGNSVQEMDFSFSSIFKK